MKFSSLIPTNATARQVRLRWCFISNNKYCKTLTIFIERACYGATLKIFKPALFLCGLTNFRGATGGNRTPKDFSTASLVLRVYQFRHDRVPIKIYYKTIFFSIFLCYNTKDRRKDEPMKKLSRILFNVSIFAMFPVIAGAAGTYYNGNMYQNPQRYGTNGGGFYNSYGAGRGYGYNQAMQNMGTRKTTTTTTTVAKKKTKKSGMVSNSKQGFNLGANVSHEFADWDFKMKNAGSKLEYDGLRWNVVSGEGVYYFGDSIPMQVKAGARYGTQYGEISMMDDDISSEKMWETIAFLVFDPNTGLDKTEYAITGTPAVSVGTGKGGSQFGFNAAFGLTDFFKFGNMKITPSIGYRYLKYKLETKDNYGLMLDILTSDSFVNCVEVQNGEIQCNPYIGFADADGEVFGFAGFAVDVDGNLMTNADGSFIILNDQTATQLDVGNTYYYEQSGVSHSYETTWMGPYLALDMDYVINDNNLVNMGVEFGLPVYNSKGNQPYRFDWAHPTSVEDKGDFGDAYHIGLNGMWATRVTDSIFLNFGFTYDYYHVSGASATTYLNAARYEDILYAYQYYYDTDQLTDEGLAYLQELKALKSNGWKTESKSEIESVYKSMGIRVGLNVKF